MVKFHEADVRRFRNVFVCKNCKAKTRTQNTKIAQGKVACKNCGQKVFRAVRKK